MTLKIPEKANLIIENYKKHKEDSRYVFPYLKDKDGKDEKVINGKTRSANSIINKHLDKFLTQNKDAILRDW